jgi:S1-C subfamily serine protease
MTLSPGNGVLSTALAAADSHTVVISREGVVRSIRLAENPAVGAGNSFGFEIGVPRPDSAGALIDRVRPGSVADSAGLRAGDRLIRVGTTTVGSTAVARRLLDRLSTRDSTTFLVVRRDSLTLGFLLRR